MKLKCTAADMTHIARELERMRSWLEHEIAELAMDIVPYPDDDPTEDEDADLLETEMKVEDYLWSRIAQLATAD